MKLKKFLIIIIILFILTNITCINATENNTHELELNNEKTIEINKNLQNSIENNELSQNYDNQTQPEILTQNNENENILSEFLPVNTQITLTINDTKDLESTGNVTVNMDFSFRAINHNGEFKTHNITIYENNTLLKSLNIGEQNLPELDLIPETPGSHPEINYKANLLFNYTVKSNTYLTTSLWGTYSNTLYFEKIKEISTSSINNNIIIDNTISSNETWTNSIKSLKKAIELVKNNGTITLDNILLIQDINETIKIIKNVTIKSRNSSILLTKTQTLLETTPNIVITFDNITFTGNNKYIISNKGKTIFNNCIFKDNSLGLIDNYGELEINNCQIIDILQFYSDRPTTETGLINNNGKLKITNTIFNNNHYLPYNLPTETTSLKGVIFNKGETVIDNVNFTNINYRFIYNDGNFKLNNILIENLITASATATYQTIKNETLNTQYTYSNYRIFSYDKTQMHGGAIYNTNNLNISNSKLQNIQGGSGGAIYNTGNLTIENTTLNKTTSITEYAGGIYNTGKTTINNSTLSESKIKSAKNGFPATYGGGIYNDGTLNINNTLITKCDSGVNAAGVAIFNNEIMNINNSQITNHEGKSGLVHDNYKSGIIYNSETAKATITKSIIKNNTVAPTPYMGNSVHFGVIKNNGEMDISGTIFDNNKYFNIFERISPGAVNIYNTGKLTVKYSYLLNTAFSSKTVSFLHNVGSATLNYNFYCLTPSTTMQNAEPNYYFIPAFEDDYYPISLNENTNITLTLGLTNGIDKIDFNDWDKLLTPGLNATITTINENGEYINFTTLLKDKYTFNFNYTNTKAIYTIYANILNYNNTAIVDIGKEFPEMTVTYNNITYNDGNKITFHVKVTGNTTPTGNVTFTYNNKKITLNLTDGKCNYTITETLKPDNYTMRIDYNGDDDYFRIIKQYCPFTVHKIRTNVTLSAPEIKIGETGKLTITITPSDAKLYGFLYYTTDYLHERNADTTGSRTFNLNNFPVGTHNLTVIFEEDEYYLGGAFTTFFTVSRYETQLNVTAADVPPGQDNTTVNITINPGDVRGEAIVEINGKNETVYLNDTTTRIPVTDLEEGTYTVTVYYPGDAKYAGSNGTTTFSVARITSRITCEISYDEHMNGHVTVNANHNNCTGEVRLYINNDDPLKLNLTDGKANFTAKFKRGVNYIYIYYYGDEYYSFSTWNRTFSIDATPVLSLETQDLRSDNTGYIRINLTDTNNIPYEYTDITIELNNQTITLKTDENGTVYYPVQLPAGKYSIKATYGNATIIKNITVKTTTKITVEIPSINQEEDLMAYVTLTDCNNQKITGDIILEINGQYYKIIATNGAGSRNLGEMKAGNYKYNATYIGEGLLASSQTTGTFNVAANNYRITGNKNINAYYGANKNYKIQLLNNNKPVKDAIITIKINKNTMQVKTDSQGYATLKLTLKPGKYTITSTYKNVKATNKITVKKTLITKNKKIKKGKTLTYTAKLLNKNGKKQKNKKITFKINGKKYKAKTNKKGIAKIKVKNLKVGKCKIITTYGKQKNTNWITVKK